MFNRDLRTVLIDKATGDINTKVTNAAATGGAYLYADVYRWFTETSGLGLAEEAIKSISPPQAKREYDLAEILKSWEHT